MLRGVWHIIEFEQQGDARVAYGKKLLPSLAGVLTREFGKDFDTTNLGHMRSLYLAFPIRDAVRREFSWTYYRNLLGHYDKAWRNLYAYANGRRAGLKQAENFQSRCDRRDCGTLPQPRIAYDP